jgi:glycosyltransferase involved in cell wall biosynthesis
VNRFLEFLKRAFDYTAREGLLSALSRVAKPSTWERKIDVLAIYAHTAGGPVGQPVDADAVDRRTIVWVMPPFTRGSGGHLNIFRFLHMVEQRGFRCSIVIQGGPWLGEAAVLRQQIRSWFVPVEAPVFIGIENAPPSYFLVATSWISAYDVRRMRGAVRRYYFVQDFEPWFSGRGSDYFLAEKSYRFGFEGITVGTWLRDLLAHDYGMKTHAVGYSFDRDALYPRPRQVDGLTRVFFYARPATARRGFELGALALSEVAKRVPQLEVVFAGQTLEEYTFPFRYRCLGVLDMASLGELYSQCDLALVLSMTNLSLLPLELMACGVPVVSNRGANVEWLLNDELAVLVDPDIADIADAIVDLIGNAQRRAELRSRGLAYAARTSWSQEGDTMAQVFQTALVSSP